jgi:hypothetical protein
LTLPHLFQLCLVERDVAEEGAERGQVLGQPVGGAQDAQGLHEKERGINKLARSFCISELVGEAIYK